MLNIVKNRLLTCLMRQVVNKYCLCNSLPMFTNSYYHHTKLFVMEDLGVGNSIEVWNIN